MHLLSYKVLEIIHEQWDINYAQKMIERLDNPLFVEEIGEFLIKQSKDFISHFMLSYFSLFILNKINLENYILNL